VNFVHIGAGAGDLDILQMLQRC